MAVHALEHTLAAFVVDDGKAARRFLEVVQKLDKDDKNVEIVDAAIAERTKRGGVKVHQTKDMGGRKGAVGGATIGVVVGTMLLGPAGPLVGGALGGTLAGLYAKFRDIGIDDKLMKTVGKEVEKGKSVVFVEYTGNWSASIGAVSDAIRAEHGLLVHSTLSPDKAAALRELVEPAVEELGGEEAVADYEVESEGAPAEEAPAEEPAPEPVAEAPAAAAVAATAAASGDDLTQIKGIGPKSAEVLTAAGITTYAALASISEPDLRRTLTDAHATVPRDVNTWAMQASFAAKGDWRGLDAFVRQTEPEAAAPRGRTNGQGPADDLTQLSGIGPKAAKALAAGGLASYAALAKANEPEIRRVLHDGDMVPPSSVSSWPMQASYAEKGDWQGLNKYNQKQAASRSTAPKAAKAAAATAVAAAATEPDDLTRLSGIGPRMEVLLNEGGVMTYDQLAHQKPEDLRLIVARGGALPPASMSTWPAQAAFAAKDDWHGLEGYNKSH